MALRTRKDTVAIVIQTLGAEVAFLLVRSDEHPIEIAYAGLEYRDATVALERAGYQAMRALPRQRKAAESALENAGRRAFEALPPAVQQAIKNHRTVLLAPDFRGRQDTIPFELMHDGKACLGATRILARFTSLSHLAATLDTRVRVPRRQRALVTAAPVVKGYDALDLAPLEQQEITATLTQRGFDAPVIDPARLSATFFTDRLAHVDVLHVSAHGESVADLEWLVLPDGKRLVVDDLLRDPQVPCAFCLPQHV